MTSYDEDNTEDTQNDDEHQKPIEVSSTKQKPQKQHSSRRCPICYTEKQPGNKQATTTITPCGHDEICGVCHLRLRYLHDNKTCPICNTSNEQVIVDYVKSQKQKKFDDYPVWGEDLGDEFVYNSETGMFFPAAYYQATIQPLFGYHCTKPGCDYDGTTTTTAKDTNDKGEEGDGGDEKSKKTLTSLRALQDHLRTEHRWTLCQLCVDHKRDFVARLPRYSPAGLQKHQVHGNGKGSGFEGHPVCEFCRPTRFYDITALHQHLQKDHYKCHICELQDLPNQYFKNYRSLERHFDAAHFLCHDVQCLTARFVVFRNEIDYQHHQRQVHGGVSSNNTKIQLEFKVASRNTVPSSAALGQEAPDLTNDFNYNLDGQAFVPAALPQQPTSSLQAMSRTAQQQQEQQLHPQHVQRTEELRQEAARLRHNDGDNNGDSAAFPSLAETDTAAESSAPLNIGWTSNSAAIIGHQKEAGAVTEQDFPSLQAPAASKKKAPTVAAMNKFMNSKKPASASSTGWTSSGGAPSSAAAVATTSSGSTAPFLSSTTTSRIVGSNNNKANLSADNFPSLGGGSGSGSGSGSATTTPARYTAANALGKKNLQSGNYSKTSNNNNATNLAADNFPALGGGGSSSGGGGGGTSRYSAVEAFTQKQKAKAAAAAPRFDSAADFPPPLVSASAAAVSVEDMKASLGPAQYKKLKKFTKEFASGELLPDAYVDHAASLFDKGYSDPDFWRFLPALVASCPSAADNDAALRYMDNLKRMRHGALNAESLSASRPSSSVKPAPAAASSGWSGAKSSNVTAAPPAQVAAAPAGRYVPPPPPAAESYSRGVQTGKKKAAWGGSGGAPTAVRVKAAPGSVAAAAASAAAPATTATKFMAKEAKQEKWQQAGGSNANSGKSKKKNKQKNELRSLAFGS